MVAFYTPQVTTGRGAIYGWPQDQAHTRDEYNNHIQAGREGQQQHEITNSYRGLSPQPLTQIRTTNGP